MRAPTFRLTLVQALVLVAQLGSGCAEPAATAPPPQHPATQPAPERRGDGPPCACPAPPTDERCQKMCRAHDLIK